MKPTENIQKPESIFPIEYHADDFGMFPAQSQRILACYEQGNLNGVSVMPNSDHLETCMEMLRPARKDVAVTVHLNIIEGRSLSTPEEVPLLTDPNGIFRVSFGNLLLHSFLPGRKAYREQLKQELRAQIYAVKAFLQEGEPLRLDGHAHYHMIPVVFDAMIDVIREEKLDVSYIRIPREYPSLYLPHWSRLQDFSAINLVKVLILNILAWRNERKYSQFLDTVEKKVFMGVFLSGRMYRENVIPLLADAVELAQKRNCGLEVLAHPGGVYEEADIAQLTCVPDIDFLTSLSREREAFLFQSVEECEVV